MKAHSLPVLVCIPDDKRKKDKPVIEKSAKPEWMPEYEKYIKDKKPSLPIKIHPLLMCDKDTAIAEYDRLYEVFCTLYKSMMCFYIEEKKEHDIPLVESIALEFLSKVNDEYWSLWDAVQEYNDVEFRLFLADDTKKLTHYVNIVRRAEHIDIKLDENEKVCKIYVKDKNNHRVCLSREYEPNKGVEKGVNDVLFEEVKQGLNNYIQFNGLYDIIIRKNHKKFDTIKEIIESAVRKRILFNPDIRSSTGKIALKCKTLYTHIAEHREALGLNSKKYAYDVGDLIIKILSLNIDPIKMVEKIQGKY